MKMSTQRKNQWLLFDKYVYNTSVFSPPELDVCDVIFYDRSYCCRNLLIAYVHLW